MLTGFFMFGISEKLYFCIEKIKKVDTNNENINYNVVTKFTAIDDIMTMGDKNPYIPASIVEAIINENAKNEELVSGVLTTMDAEGRINAVTIIYRKSYPYMLKPEINKFDAMLYTGTEENKKAIKKFLKHYHVWWRSFDNTNNIILTKKGKSTLLVKPGNYIVIGKNKKVMNYSEEEFTNMFTEIKD